MLAHFEGRASRLPCRTYADPIPAWEPPDQRAARRHITGRGVDEVEEAEIGMAEAEYEGTKISVQDETILIEQNRKVIRLSTDAVASVRIWRALTGCSLDLFVPHGDAVERFSAVFQYPMSSPFMRVASRIRHVTARTPS